MAPLGTEVLQIISPTDHLHGVFMHRTHGTIALLSSKTPVANRSRTGSITNKVTATDCILEATHRLAVAIEGIQEAAPHKLQAIKLLCHILLGKRIPKLSHPAPPTLLHDSNADKEPIHMWDRTIHAQPIFPANATLRAPQTGRAIIDNDDDAPPHSIPAVHTGSRRHMGTVGSTGLLRNLGPGFKPLRC
jgi:hypothetical protein